ncbi:MAG: hypothetical protein Q9178_007039 [Gyalolechia marmorata]
MRRGFPTTSLILLMLVISSIQVNVIITHMPVPGQPATIICRNLPPGVCCRRIWGSDDGDVIWHQQGTAAKIEFQNLLPGDIAAVWARPGRVFAPFNGNDCSTRVVLTRHGPGDLSFTPTEIGHEPGGGSYISVGQMKLPPDVSTASALLIEGIFGLVWGGGQWFASEAARRKFGSGGLRSKGKRGIVSEKKGTLFARPPVRWVNPDTIRFNGTEYTSVGGQNPVYKDSNGVSLDLMTMKPRND